jgi:hypothetical protein
MIQPSNSNNPKDVLGRKKPGISAIPPVALIHESMAMNNGASKYGPYNWRAKTVSCRVYIDAMFRHLLAYLDGETNAADSGIHHLGHLRASAGIILDAEANGTLVDDRPVPGKASEVLERLTEKTQPIADGEIVRMDDPRLLTAIQMEQLRGMQDINAKPRRRCYICGPMRGRPLLNFPAFDEARDLAKSWDWDPISPADMDRENNIKEDYQNTFKPEETREFVKRDIAALLTLRAENNDAIALLPEWWLSTGGLAEFFVARWLGLKVVNAKTMEPFSQNWLDSHGFGVVVTAIRKYLGDKNP